MNRPVTIGSVIHAAKEGGYESQSDVAARLAKLPLLDYELVREEEAKKLGARTSVLDKVVEAARGTNSDENDKATMFPKVELWPDPIDGAELLDEIRATIYRFIICEPETAIAAALWCVFTWLIVRFRLRRLPSLQPRKKGAAKRNC